MLAPLRHQLQLPRPAGPRGRGPAAGGTEQLPDLQEIRFERVHQPGGLPVLGRRADRDRVLLDDVPDTETVAGRRAEAKVPQRRVAAVRGRQDRVVDLVPARVVEDGRRRRHSARAPDAAVPARGDAIFRRSRGELRGPDVRPVLGRTRVAVRAGLHAVVHRRRFVKRALPETVQSVEMAILALPFRALLCNSNVFLGRFSEGFHLLLGRVVPPERLDELDRLPRNRTDRLGPAVEEHLRHRRLVRIFDTAVETIVGGLESHLHESVGREAHRGDKVLPVPGEVEDFDFVLLEKIGKVRLCEPQGNAKLRSHVPLQLARRGAHVAKTPGVSFRGIGAARRPQAGRLTVDALGKSKDGVRVDIAGKAEDRVTVHAGMFKVDPGTTVLADDDLKLVIPPVDAGSNLHTSDDFAGTTQHIGTELRRGGRLGVVQTENEEGSIDDVQAFRVVRTRVLRQDLSQA